MNYVVITFLAVLVVALASFTVVLARRVRYLLVGRLESRHDHLGRRASGFVVSVLGQKKLFKEPLGILHFFLFWGFIIVAFGALQIIGEGLHEAFSLPLFGDWPAFYLLQDVFIVLVIVSVLAAAVYRYVLRPKRLEASLEAGVILALILGIMVAALLYSGLRYALDHPDSHALAPATQAVAAVVESGEWSSATLDAAAWVFWWLHVLFMLAFLIYIPLSKHFHLIACPVNEFFRNLKPRGGQIEKLDFESEDVEEFGVSHIEGFTHWQLLDLYACAECGRCTDNCPAAMSGKSLSPQSLITKLRDHLVERGPELIRDGRRAEDEGEAESSPAAKPVTMIGDVISEDEIWACTTCYSCQEQCPVENEHVNKIIDMRRSLVLDRGEFPREAQLVCRNVEKNGNPWGNGAHTRGAWAEELGVAVAEAGQVGEYLFWVGCAGAFDDRAVRVSTALVKLLQAAKVSFSILGSSETCCGDPMRRLGNEYLFEMLATENVETLNGLGVTKIVTGCPHCLNTLKNEYPAFGGTYEVIHHTQLLADLMREGRVPLGNGLTAARVAYHDSCYLGRYQGEYRAPREVLAAVPGTAVLEARRNRSKSVCCGAGGGRMWMEEEADQRVNELRVEQLLETNPSIIGANCPYCLTMIEDGLKSVDGGGAVRVMDLAEILDEALNDVRDETPEAPIESLQEAIT